MNREHFKAAYAQALAVAVVEHGEDYPWYSGPESLAVVTGRMLAAIDRGSFNKDSHAFKATCKALGLKHTYSAIREFIGA